METSDLRGEFDAAMSRLQEDEPAGLEHILKNRQAIFAKFAETFEDRAVSAHYGGDHQFSQ